MRTRRLWKYSKLILLAVVIVGACADNVFATTSSSTNYQVTETEFSAMSSSQNCSTHYCAKASIGDMASGNSKSSNGTSSAVFGPLTDSEPLLDVIVDPGESNLGVLTTEKTSFKTTTIRIRNYLSDGYTLQITGNPPKYKNHTLSTPDTPTAARPGTEQFGINVAANTTPNVGASPLQVPSSQTSFGKATDDYRISDLFKYTSGDVVARSQSESGRTDYTISMIVNVASSTPAGHYSGDFSAIVTPAY